MSLRACRSAAAAPGRTSGLIRSRGPIGLALVLLLAGTAFGQQAAPPGQQEETIVRLPAVQVTMPPLDLLPRSATPAHVDTLTSGELDGAHPAVLPDALERLPGVTLENEQGTPFQPTLTLRGFVASPVTGLPQGVSVFLDGVRVNEPTVEEVNFDLIPLEAVDRVEIIRGPSALFGRNTLGGAVNLLTRRGDEVREIIPQISAGSFGRVDTRFRLGGTARPFDYFLSFTRTAEDGYRDFTPATVNRVFGKLGFERGDTDVTVSYQWSRDKVFQAGSLPESELSRNRRANLTAGDYFKPELNFAIINGEQRFGESLTANLNAFVRALSVTQFNANLITANTKLENNTLSTGGGVQLKYRSTIFSLPSLLVGGVEYGWTRVTSRTLEETDGSFEPEGDLADSQNSFAVYAQHALTLFRDFTGPRSSVVLTISGRYDWLRHAIVDRLGGPSGSTDTYSRFNPRVGVNVNFAEGVGAYAAYAQGFRAPAFLELTCAGPGAVCPGLQVGVAPDPPLKAVKARSFEAGAHARVAAWLRAEVSGYWTDLTDEIFAVTPTGTTGVFFQNVTATRRQGVELGLRGRFGGVLDPYVNYAFTRATFRGRGELATPIPPGTETVQQGDRLPLVPEHRINVGVDYRPWPWLQLTAGAGWVGSQFLRGDESNQQRPLAPYWFTQAGASVRWRGLEGFVQINNVLNAKYETFGTFAPNGLQPGNPVERFLTPAPPINVLAGLQYVF
jgi:iron complex outermembrane receptor protein